MQSEHKTLSFTQAMQIGLEHYQAGRLPEAELMYRRALEMDPNNPDALHLCAIVVHQSGRNSLSLQLIDSAVRCCPENPDFLNSRGNVLQALMRHEEALASYDKSLSIKSDHAGVLSNRGNVLQALIRHEEALASYDKALSITSDSAGTLYNRGIALEKLKRFEEALVSYDKALANKPDYAEALGNRGNTLQALKRYDEALISYDKALAIKTDYVSAFFNRGSALRALNRYDEAIFSYDMALAIKPDHAEAWYDRGVALEKLKRHDEALTSYDRALSIRPDYAEVLSDRGNSLLALGRYGEALISYDSALLIRPNYVEALCNRGNVLCAMEHYDEALASYDKAISFQPDYSAARWNSSLCRLRLGDFERGWREYESRWECLLPHAKRNCVQPLWIGDKEISGKTILLHAEQGLGDTIQFARYAQEVAQRGANVILEVQPLLKSLFADMPGVHLVLSRGDPLPEFDFHCPLLSLPLALDTTLGRVPARIPYLSVESKTVTGWRAKLARRNEKLVGVCWRGNASYVHDAARSIPFAHFAPLLSVPGVRFISLQKELLEQERELAETLSLTHLGLDFKNTAELVAALDLVVTVDTVWAHWAGAVGTPFWVLLSRVPHWVWLLDRADSPWYPSAKLLRQSRNGDWNSVVARAELELKSMLEK